MCPSNALFNFLSDTKEKGSNFFLIYADKNVLSNREISRLSSPIVNHTHRTNTKLDIVFEKRLIKKKTLLQSSKTFSGQAG